MAVILDTNALSAFVDGDQRLQRVLTGEAELALPVIVLGEYLFGIRQSRLKASYENWIKTNLGFFDLLPIVRETAEHYAEIRRELKAAGTPIPMNDLWIAALARHHQMRLVTRGRHFGVIPGVRVLAW